VRKFFSTLLILISAGVLAFSAYLAANPQEQARQKQDNMLYNDVKSLAESIERYYKNKRALPWREDFIPKYVLLTEMREVYEKLVAEVGLFDIAQDVQSRIFISQDKQENQVLVCFLPKSKVFRLHAEDEGRKIGNDFAFCAVKKLE
jgi:hypothetical protein